MRHLGNRNGRLGFLTFGFLLAVGLPAPAMPANGGQLVSSLAGAATEITGTVTDSANGGPIKGAEVSVVGTRIRAKTNEQGVYRLTGVPEGDQVLRVRRIGYRNTIIEVGVPETGLVTVDLVMAPSARQLVPAAVTVVAAKDIEERGYGSIFDMFKGDVPGVFAQSKDPYGYPSLSIRGASAAQQGRSAVIILDGRRLTDPSILNQLDPRSIERVEILKGPQASTMYGGDPNSGGVIAITTKKAWRGRLAAARGSDLAERIINLRRELKAIERDLDELLEALVELEAGGRSRFVEESSQE